MDTTFKHKDRKKSGDTENVISRPSDERSEQWGRVVAQLKGNQGKSFEESNREQENEHKPIEANSVTLGDRIIQLDSQENRNGGEVGTHVRNEPSRDNRISEQDSTPSATNESIDTASDSEIIERSSDDFTALLREHLPGGKLLTRDLSLTQISRLKYLKEALKKAQEELEGIPREGNFETLKPTRQFLEKKIESLITAITNLRLEVSGINERELLQEGTLDIASASGTLINTTSTGITGFASYISSSVFPGILLTLLKGLSIFTGTLSMVTSAYYGRKAWNAISAHENVEDATQKFKSSLKEKRTDPAKPTDLEVAVKTIWRNQNKNLKKAEAGYEGFNFLYGGIFILGKVGALVAASSTAAGLAGAVGGTVAILSNPIGWGILGVTGGIAIGICLYKGSKWLMGHLENKKWAIIAAEAQQEIDQIESKLDRDNPADSRLNSDSNAGIREYLRPLKNLYLSFCSDLYLKEKEGVLQKNQVGFFKLQQSEDSFGSASKLKIAKATKARAERKLLKLDPVWSALIIVEHLNQELKAKNPSFQDALSEDSLLVESLECGDLGKYLVECGFSKQELYDLSQGFKSMRKDADNENKEQMKKMFQIVLKKLNLT